MALEGSIIDEPEVDLDSAAARLLERWTTKKKEAAPQEEAPAAKPAKAEEEHEEQPEPEVEETEEEQEEAPARRAAADDDEVVVTVDGQEHKVAVKDLKRLFGQETALTRKSQEVATVRQQAQAEVEKNVAVLNKLKGRAEERYAPYKEVDWSLAAQQLSPDDYKQLKAAHDVLKGDVDYFQAELENTVKEAREQHSQQMQAAVVEAANKCVAALSNADDPKTYIEGFGEPLYNEIRQYAVDAGVPQQLIDNTYDPVAIKLIHKAMLFDKAQKTAVKKLATAPRNVSKTPTNDGAAAGGGRRQALEKLRQSGDPDDAAAALLAKWSA